MTATTSARAFIASHDLPAVVTLIEWADSMECSTLTARRRLAAEGNSWRGVRDETLHRVARRHAAEGMTGPETAITMGFADAGCFYRAYKRWTGCTYREHRRKGVI